MRLPCGLPRIAARMPSCGAGTPRSAAGRCCHARRRVSAGGVASGMSAGGEGIIGGNDNKRVITMVWRNEKSESKIIGNRSGTRHSGVPHRAAYGANATPLRPASPPRRVPAATSRYSCAAALACLPHAVCMPAFAGAPPPPWLPSGALPPLPAGLPSWLRRLPAISLAAALLPRAFSWRCHRERCCHRCRYRAH